MCLMWPSQSIKVFEIVANIKNYEIAYKNLDF